jgi:hypothetical protein
MSEPVRHGNAIHTIATSGAEPVRLRTRAQHARRAEVCRRAQVALADWMAVDV